MPILCSEKTLWQLAGDVPNLLTVQQVNDVSPHETVVPVVHFAGYEELSTKVLECSFFVALVFCRLLREQTKPAKKWTAHLCEIVGGHSPPARC